MSSHASELESRGHVTKTVEIRGKGKTKKIFIFAVVCRANLGG